MLEAMFTCERFSRGIYKFKKLYFLSPALLLWEENHPAEQTCQAFCMSGTTLLGCGTDTEDKEPVCMRLMPRTYLSKQGWEVGGTVLEQTRWSHSKATPHVLVFSQLVPHQTICGPVYPRAEVVMQNCAYACALDVLIITSDT